MLGIHSAGLLFNLESNNHKAKKVQDSVKEDNGFRENKNLIKPNIEHLKANFISFKGDNQDIQTKPDVVTKENPPNPDNEKKELASIKDVYEFAGINYLNQVAKRGKLPKFDHYNRPALLTAINLAAKKNVNLLHNPDSSPEYVAYSFANMMAKGDLKNLGFSTRNTDVLLLDNDDELLQQNLTELSDQSDIDNKKRVVFVKNFSPEDITDLDLLSDKVQIIGFIQKSDEEEDYDYHSPKELRSEANWYLSSKIVEMVDPSPDKTKKFLLENPDLIKDITSKYSRKIIVTDKAIAEVIKSSTTGVSGEFPNKALNLLDSVIPATMSFKEPDKSALVITDNDVRNTIKAYPELLEPPVSDSGMFSVKLDTGVKLSDVGGIDNVKDEIKENILGYLENPEKFKEQGAPIPKGIILYGPPGTGKTLTAKAIAGEANVPFISCSASGFIEEYVGVGAKRVRELFSFARTEARKHDSKTAIIFIDEFDSIAKARGGLDENSEDRQTLNQLLTELDGINSDSDVHIVVMAATNRLDDLDEAAIRAGRFDVKIEVPNPSYNKQARYEILKVHSRNKKFRGEEEKEKILKEVADFTQGFSGADLAEMMNIAARIVANRTSNKFITFDDMQEARLQALAGRIKKYDLPSWTKESTIGHECGHALINQTMIDMSEHPWDKPYENSLITLEERGDYLGCVYTKLGENPHISFDSLIAEIAGDYGGYFVEKMRHGSNLDGVSADLENATNLVTEAITKYGLGPNTKMISLSANDYVKDLMKIKVEKDINLITGTSARISELIVNFHKDFIEGYIEKYRNNAGKGGNNLSGEQFKEMLNKWLKDSGKDKELPVLQQEIKILINDARGGKLNRDKDNVLKQKAEKALQSK